MTDTTQDQKKLTERAVWEDKHHRQFDYKEQQSRCMVCGETDNRHTYTCVFYDTK